MSAEPKPPATPAKPILHGLLAEYTTPADLIAAAHQVREAGFKRWDTFTPFPVHGIDGAMGIKPTVLPWLVFGAGLVGCITGVVLQWWTNSIDYPWIVSGKPMWSLPANIPIIFELTVLFSAFAAMFGMLGLNNLPLYSHPLDLKQRFARATDDRFFLLVEAGDPRFEVEATRALLEATHAVDVDEVMDPEHSGTAVPKELVYALIVAAVAGLVPPAMIASARSTKGREPRIHLVQDMDFQVKYKTQKANSFFADGSSMRNPVAGTVAVGSLRSDHFTFGKVDGEWARTFPPEVELGAATMARGKQRFDIYCATCHGLAGNGDGMINARAEQLAQGTWVPPTNLNQDYLRQQPVGQLFDSITNGVRNMPGYGHAVSAEDRWAILLYVRALQRRGAAKLDDVPATERGALE